MRQTCIVALGLALWTTAGGQLAAQQKPEVPATYLGIPLTAAQQTRFDSAIQKWQQDGSLQDVSLMEKRHDDVLQAVLTPEQQKVLQRNRQIVDLARPTNRTKRTRMLMGTNLTDKQMTELKKLLAEQEEKRRAFLGDTASPAYSQNWERIYPELYTKELDAFRALLTPEQQKVAAPEYELLKAAWSKATRNPTSSGR